VEAKEIDEVLYKEDPNDIQMELVIKNDRKILEHQGDDNR